MVSRFRPIGTLVFLLFLFSLLPLTPAQAVSNDAAVSPQGAVPRFEAGDCADFDIPGALESVRETTCGYTVVPERHENPTGKTIRLGTVVLRAKASANNGNAARPPDPIFLAQGGPGGSTLHDFPGILLTSKLTNSAYDLVLWDQRGTLYTQPNLVCKETQDLTLATLDKIYSDEENLRLSLDALAKCRDRLTKEGIDLSAYTSVENAGDVESIRQALGYNQINLYGVSYGTLLALDVMRLYPQSLRSVIIDSVVPPDNTFIPDLLNTNMRSMRLIFANCAAQPDCNRTYPNLEQVFNKLIDKLNQNPAHITVTDSKSGKTYPAQMNGDNFASILFFALYPTDFIPLIPQVIYETDRGNYSFIERVFALVVFDLSISDGMYYSVNCSDYYQQEANTDPNSNPLQLSPELQKIRKASINSMLASCKLWNVQEQDPKVDAPVKSDIPTLVLSGSYDPATPPADAQHVAQTLSHSYLFTFPAGGHGEAMGNACGDQILLEFVNNPAQKPDGSCISGSGPTFVTPASMVRLPKLIGLLNLEGGSVPQFIVFAVGLLLLATALLVYPVAGIVGLFRGRPQPAPVYPAGVDSSGQPYYAPPPPARPKPPVIWRLAPLLAVGNAILLLLFFIILLVVVYGLAMENNQSLVVGLPGSSRPLFLLTPLALLATVIMLVLALLAWARRWGSGLGRTYFSLLALAALACIVVLGIWGMLTAVLPV